MASNCRAKNPATCKVHGTTGTLIHLQMERDKAKATAERTNKGKDWKRYFTLKSEAENTKDEPDNDEAENKEDEAGKKEFFGSSIWNQISMMQERSKVNGVLRATIKKAFQDIRGFDKNYPSITESTRKEIVETLMNREDAVIKHDGGPSTAASIVREALAPYENTSDDGASALVTVKLFKALGRDEEVSSDMEEKAYQHAQRPALGASFEAQAEAMVHVLNKHKVFGNTLDGEWLKSEMRGFKGMVRDQATGNDSHNSLELTYRGSNVRLLVEAKVRDNEIVITDFKAYDHPSKNSHMDYEGLNKDLAAMWSDEN